MPSRRIGVVYSVYGDESSDQGKSRVFAVAGLFGSEDDWYGVRNEWIKRTDGKIFHAADCECGKGEYANTSRSDNLALYKDLTKIIAQSRLLGFGSALSIAHFKKYVGQFLGEEPYYLCFNIVVTQLTRAAAMCLPPDTVKFSFDRNFDTQHNASMLYGYLANLEEWEERKYMADEISFVTRKEIGIQAADLVARETMKELDRIITGKPRFRRKSISALGLDGKVQFRLYTEDWFKELSRFAATESQRTGRAYSMKTYHVWRERYGLMDNPSTRIRYTAYLDSIEKQEISD